MQLGLVFMDSGHTETGAALVDQAIRLLDWMQVAFSMTSATSKAASMLEATLPDQVLLCRDATKHCATLRPASWVPKPAGRKHG